MVPLPENGYSSGTYKVPIGAPVVAVISLLSGCMCGAAHSHPSPHPVPAGGKYYSSCRLKLSQRFCFYSSAFETEKI